MRLSDMICRITQIAEYMKDYVRNDNGGQLQLVSDLVQHRAVAPWCSLWDNGRKLAFQRHIGQVFELALTAS